MTSDLHRLAAAFVLDALEPDEEAAFVAHLTECDTCPGEIAEFRETAALLAATTPEAPPSNVKDGVMTQIAQTRQLAPTTSPLQTRSSAPGRSSLQRPRYQFVALAAAAVIAIVAIATAVVTRAGSDPIDQLVASSDAVELALDGEIGEDVRIVWSPERSEIAVLADSLPAPGEGLAYELWFLLDNGVSPAGVFTPDADGTVRTFLAVDNLAASTLDPDGWGITIEPEAGSLQPTGDVILVGTF